MIVSLNSGTPFETYIGMDWRNSLLQVCHLSCYCSSIGNFSVNKRCLVLVSSHGLVSSWVRVRSRQCRESGLVRDAQLPGRLRHRKYMRKKAEKRKIKVTVGTRLEVGFTIHDLFTLAAHAVVAFYHRPGGSGVIGRGFLRFALTATYPPILASDWKQTR